MTSKDYQKFVLVLRNKYAPVAAAGKTPSYLLWRQIVHGVADVFAEDNPRFNRAKFYEACGMEE